MLKLYYTPGACSIAPHIVLEEIGVPFETVRINLVEGEQETPEYRAINPRARVPALAVDGEIVTEVPALLTYLATLRPEADLVPPAGSVEFGRCFEWLGFLSSSVHIAYAQLRRPGRFVPLDFPAIDDLAEHGRERMKALYREIEGLFGSPWAVGAQYTIADPYLLPFYLWSARVGIDLAQECPRYTEWKARIAERPAVQRTAAREGIAL